jgi:hypothetical protein
MFRIYIIHPAWVATNKAYPLRKVVSENEKRSYWTGMRWGAKRLAEQFAELDVVRAEVQRIHQNGYNVRFSVMADENLPRIEEVSAMPSVSQKGPLV